MSHPDPLFDPDNSYEEDGMSNNFTDYHYDYHDDFYGDDSASSHPDAAHEVSTHFDDPELDDHEDDFDDFEDYYDESMDGDHDSGMTSAGWGTDEDYGYYGEDY
jgi:hypothetical protein